MNHKIWKVRGVLGRLLNSVCYKFPCGGEEIRCHLPQCACPFKDVILSMFGNLKILDSRLP
jgi:prepilin signal peptidase PulO-like enzyme (type II secretory pathway)